MLIVDTYNVLHAAPRVDPGLGGLTLSGLASLLASSRFQSVGVLLVCDGSGGRAGLDDALTHPEAPIRVVFAGPGKDADTAIQRLIMDEEHKGKAGAITVVSSDKGVLAAAIGPFGPKPRRMTSEQFLRAILDDAVRDARTTSGIAAPKPGPLDEDATARWLREFGMDPARVPRLSEPGSGVPRLSEPDSPAGSKNRNTQTPGSENRGTQPPPQDWPDGIDPDDLDMRKWLKE